MIEAEIRELAEHTRIVQRGTIVKLIEADDMICRVCGDQVPYQPRSATKVNK